MNRLDKIFKLKPSNIPWSEYELPENEKTLTIWHDPKFQSRPGKLNGMYGHKWTKEELKKMSDSKKGQIGRMFKWRITTPEGKVIVRENLVQFCRDNIGDNSWQNLIQRGKHIGYTAKKLGRA